MGCGFVVKSRRGCDAGQKHVRRKLEEIDYEREKPRERREKQAQGEEEEEEEEKEIS
jgi:hypothetical protein